MFRKILISIGILFLCLGSYGTFGSNLVAAENQKPEPAYAKWGRLAMQETKKKYPMAQIIDYLHMGRQVKNDTTQERFKLWMRQDNKEFGVFVTITFDTKTEMVKNIIFVKTDR